MKLSQSNKSIVDDKQCRGGRGPILKPLLRKKELAMSSRRSGEQLPEESVENLSLNLKLDWTKNPKPHYKCAMYGGMG